MIFQFYNFSISPSLYIVNRQIVNQKINLISRESRESREKSEKPGLMNISHTDFTDLTKHASFHSRVLSGAQTLGEADKRGQSDALSVRFVISVRPNSAMKENFASFARFA